MIAASALVANATTRRGPEGCPGSASAASATPQSTKQIAAVPVATPLFNTGMSSAQPSSTMPPADADATPAARAVAMQLR